MPLFKGTFSIFMLAGVLCLVRASAAQPTVKFTEYEHLRGDFEQIKKIQDLAVELRSSGDFEIFQSGGSEKRPVIHWNLRKPSVSFVCIDGEGIVIQKGVGQAKRTVEFSQVSEGLGVQLKILSRLLSFDTATLEKQFTLEHNAPTVTIIPKKAEDAFFASAQVTVDVRGFAQKVLIKERTGDELSITFSKVTTVNEGIAGKGDKVGTRAASETQCVR